MADLQRVESPLMNAEEEKSGTVAQQSTSVIYPPVNGTVGSPSSRKSTRQATRTGTGMSGTSNGEPAPPLKKRLTSLFVKEHPLKREPTWRESGLAIVKASWLNVLLVFIPVGWALHFTNVGGDQKDTIVFVFTFLAIIPLAKLLGFGTEEVALRVGQALGGLINATLGNAVELIVAIIALVKCELRVVQSSLLGSILSNLLLVLGMCFFVSGIRYSEQGFGVASAQQYSSLLVISVITVLIPAGFHGAFSSSLSDAQEVADILAMSRGASVLLLVCYGGFLVFSLFTHQHLFADVATGEATAGVGEGRVIWRTNHRAFRQAKSVGINIPQAVETGTAEDDEEEEEEEAQLNLWAALLLLAVVTVLVAVTAEFLVDSISGLTEQHPEVSVQWVGLILLPIVGNAAEHVTAVTVSVKDKLDLSMGVAVGSSIQIALFVVPFLVILAWILDKPLSLLFDPFESIVLFLSVLLVNYCISDGRSNWLEGWLLMIVYLLLAVAFWFYPSDATPENVLFRCGNVV